MNNQPINPNISGYEYFAYMYVNYLYYTSEQPLQHGSYEFFNYVLPIITNDMNPFIYDNEFSVNKTKLESRMKSLDLMVDNIVGDMTKIPDTDIFKNIILNPIISEWNASSDSDLFSMTDHIKINLIFKTLTKLLIHINKDYLLYNYNLFIVTDYDNNNNGKHKPVDGGSIKKKSYFNKKKN